MNGNLSPHRPRVIIDQDIPFLRGSLEPNFETVYLPGSAIAPSDCQKADALIIRTRTRCDRALLEGSSVRLIASATIGTDHIDSAYCASRGIAVTNAPGCNAWAVVQWVISVMGLINARAHLGFREWTVGIVGVGSIGGRLAALLEHLGVKTLLCDPFRASSPVENFVPLEHLARHADLITLHVPYTTSGPHPTHHLLGREIFASMRRRPYILNTSRGGVIDDYSLLEAYARRQVRGFALDVYEEEPDLPPVLLEQALVATPHIAGYSVQGKLAGTAAVLRDVGTFFGITPPEPVVPAGPEGEAPFLGGYSLLDLSPTYSPMADTRALRAAPQRFEWLRSHYALRNDYRAYRIGSQGLRQILDLLP